MDNNIKIKIDKTKYLLKRLQEEKNRLIRAEQVLEKVQEKYKWDNDHKIRAGIAKWLFKPQTLNKGLVTSGAGMAAAFVFSPTALPLVSVIFGSIGFFKGISLMTNGNIVCEQNQKNKNFLAETAYKLRENEELQIFLSENANKLDRNEVDKLVELLQKEHENLEISRDIMQLVLMDEKHGLMPFTAKALIKDFDKKLKADPTLLGEYPLIQFTKMGKIIMKKSDDRQTKEQQLEYLNKKKQVMLTILGFHSEAEYFGREKTFIEIDNKEFVEITNQTKQLEREIQIMNTEALLSSENDLLKLQKEALESELSKYKELEKARTEYIDENQYIENGIAFEFSSPMSN